MELATLLEQARSASPDRRIETRDAIAAHGAHAIEGVRPWLGDERLAAFAVRVIERVGLDGAPEEAAKALRAARKTVPAGVADDVEQSLARLRAAARPAAAPKAVTQPAAPAARPAARPTSVSRRPR